MKKIYALVALILAAIGSVTGQSKNDLAFIKENVYQNGQLLNDLDTILLGSKISLEVKIKNTGTAVWPAGNIPFGIGVKTPGVTEAKANYRTLNSIYIPVDIQPNAIFTTGKVDITVDTLFKKDSLNIIIVWPTGSFKDDNPNNDRAYMTFFVKEDPKLVSGIGKNAISCSGISLYPNPATDQVQIYLGQPKGNTEICIRDISGRIITRQHVPAGTPGLSVALNQNGIPLPVGIYMVTVETGNTREVRKLMIAR